MGTGAIDPDAQPATEAEVFAAQAGSFENKGEGPMLSLPIRIAHGEQPGRLRYEVLDIKDEAGALLDITPHTGPVYAYPDYGQDGGVFLAGTMVTPDKIGPYTAFSDYGRVRARASFFTLVPDAQGSSRNVQGGGTVTRHTSARQGAYVLRYKTAPDDIVNRAPEGTGLVTASFYACDRGPEWLLPAQSQARLQASPTPDGQTVVIESPTPPRVRFRVDRPSAMLQVVRDMNFVPRDYN